MSARRALAGEWGGSGPFVSCLIAVLVYLATVAIAGLLLVDRTGSQWQDAFSRRITVQIPADTTAGDPNDRLEAALAAIRALPEAAHADRVPEQQIASALGPLAGAGAAANLLPTVIDVRLQPDAEPRIDDVASRIRQTLPVATVDVRASQLEPALRLMRAVRLLSLLLVAVLTGTLIAAVVFATRARLAMQRDTIDVLHLLGGDNRDIERIVAGQALRTALTGALGGLACAVLTLLGFGWLAASPEGFSANDLALSWLVALAIAAIPPAAAAIAGVTAFLTVRRTLAALP